VKGRAGQEGRLESAFRDAGPRIVAALAARFRDLDLAQDAFAEAGLGRDSSKPAEKPSVSEAWR
jgi:RNA polymerase sigma-70 factor (ECF subfamily)